MPKGKRVKGKQPKAMIESQESAAPELSDSTGGTVSSKPAVKKVAKRKSHVRRAAAKKAKPRAKAKSPARRTPQKTLSQGRLRFTPAERTKILAVARREGLTGAKAAKRFGISQVTYYLWRKKASTGSQRGVARRRLGTRLDGRNIAEIVRREVRARIAAMLPEILKSEIAGSFGSSRRGR